MITIIKLVKKGVLHENIYVFMIVLAIANMICSIISAFQESCSQIFFVNADVFLSATLGGFFLPVVIICLTFDITALIIRIAKN